MKTRWQRFFQWSQVASKDSPLKRSRSQIFNVYVWIIIFAVVVVTIINAGIFIQAPSLETQIYLVQGALSILLFLGLWRLNQAGFTSLASYLFLALQIIFIITFFDAKSLDSYLIVFTIPIFFSSFLLSPSSSLVFGALCIIGYSITNTFSPDSGTYNYVSMTVAGLVSLVSWYIAALMTNTIQKVVDSEQALQEDIQRREKAEKAFHESENRFKAAFESAAFGMCLVSSEGILLWVNLALAEMTGYSPEELVGKELRSITYQGDESIWEEAMQCMLHGDAASARLEKRCCHRDGHPVFVEVNSTLLRDQSGQPLHFVTQVLDITARKQAEEALRASEERLRLIADSMVDIVCMIDKNNIFQYVSPSVQKVLGYTPEELIGKRSFDFVPPEERESKYRDVPGIIKDLDKPIIVSLRHKNGEYRSLESLGRFILDEKGEVSGWVVGNRDVTDRVEAEKALEEERASLARRVEERTEELNIANAELAQALRLKDEFMASMSHELRTPLTGILGLSEALQGNIYGDLNEKQAVSIHYIEESGRHLLSLINDILDLSKIQSGQTDLELRMVNLETVCTASLRLVMQGAQQKRLRVHTLYDEEVDYIFADERRLKQIMVNLLSNAIKFTPEGGAFGIEVKGDKPNQNVKITVWDTGIGIAPEDRKKLFKPFIQLDSRLAREYTGTGLGLALILSLVEMHGGGVSVESEPGKGSRFTIVLPWKGMMEDVVEVGGQTEYSGFVNLNSALIIEDSEVAAEQLTRYLEQINIRAVIHSAGRDVIEKVIEVKPDLILLDILLPGRHGWEVLEELKKDERTRSIPVIVVTVVDERKRGLEIGACDYLIKPVNAEMLQKAIENLEKRFFFQKEKASSIEPENPNGKLSPLVLVVEDNDMNLEVYVDLLESRGYRVAAARDGLEAVERVKQIEPDLILMDIQMPKMDGLEAIRKIRADSMENKVPIIALTALAMSGDRERCLEAGADAYLSKPISFTQLFQIMRDLMGIGPENL